MWRGVCVEVCGEVGRWGGAPPCLPLPTAVTPTLPGEPEPEPRRRARLGWRVAGLVVEVGGPEVTHVGGCCVPPPLPSFRLQLQPGAMLLGVLRCQALRVVSGGGGTCCCGCLVQEEDRRPGRGLSDLCFVLFLHRITSQSCCPTNSFSFSFSFSHCC